MNKSREVMGVVAAVTLGCVPALAQELKNEALITLGTAGSPVPQLERAGIATLIQVNGSSYLFDAGAGVTEQLAHAGVSLSEINSIFMTHLHDDHYSGLGTFFGNLWTLRPERTVQVFGPSMTAHMISGLQKFQEPNSIIRAVERNFPHDPSLWEVVEFSDDGLVYEDENIRVHAIENTHFHFPEGSKPYGRTQSLSYRVETPSRTIVLTGDTGYFDGLVDFAKGADVLVAEVMDPDEVLQMLQGKMPEKMSDDLYERRKFHMEDEHLTPESAGTLAELAGIDTLVFSHMPERTDPKNSDHDDFVARAKAVFDGRVIAAKDLSRFCQVAEEVKLQMILGL